MPARIAFLRLLKTIASILVVALIAMQFARPIRNVSTEVSPHDITRKYKVPKDVQSMLQRACYDCHSNNTNYPWYANIQPVGWWLDAHVVDGKRHLDFSEFGRYSPKRAASKLSSVIDEVEGGTMPLKSYTPMHPEARLTKEEVKKLVAWAEALMDEIEEAN